MNSARFWLVCSVLAVLALLSGTVSVVPQGTGTFISEFPHPRVILHYHPTEDDDFRLSNVRDALTLGCHGLELDLRYRNGEVRCNHEPPTRQNPTLKEVIDEVVRWKGASSSVQRDNRQFFLVLDLKEADNALFDGVEQILENYPAHLSTAARPGDPPRGITVVITGYSQDFYQRLQRDQATLNRLCIVEGVTYGSQITNLSAGKVPFQWVQSISHEDERGRINTEHQKRNNVRVWNTEGESDLRLALATGADSVSVNPGEINRFKEIVLHQQPRGAFASLAVRGTQPLLTWRGRDSNNLYMALGAAGPSGLIFPRQLALTYFLQQTPLAIAPAAALTPDGKVVIVYEGTTNQRLWYVSGSFSSPDRFLTFDGGEQPLTLPGDAGRRGRNPSVAVAPNGRVLVVYEGTDAQRLWYVSGFLNNVGKLIGTEYSLTEGNARRGYTPSIAIDSSGHAVVVYQGTSDQKLWYVSGTLDGAGRIMGREFSLTEGDARRGFTPSVAMDRNGRVLIVYQGTSGQQLWYVSGTLDGTGRILGKEYRLTEGEARRGYRPTAGFDNVGSAFIHYQGTSEAKLWYVVGQLDRQGRLVGQERLLDMGMDRR